MPGIDELMDAIAGTQMSQEERAARAIVDFKRKIRKARALWCHDTNDDKVANDFLDAFDAIVDSTQMIRITPSLASVVSDFLAAFEQGLSMLFDMGKFRAFHLKDVAGIPAPEGFIDIRDETKRTAEDDDLIRHMGDDEVEDDPS